MAPENAGPGFPIVVVGPHRSGTSLVSQILTALGVCMGRCLTEKNESILILQMNEHLLFQNGATWDDPEPIIRKLEAIEESGTLHTHADRLSKFLLANFSSFDTEISALSEWNEIKKPWGFKDPRVCVLLPLFIAIFPTARFLAVRRDLDDVARSLHWRHVNSGGRLGAITRGICSTLEGARRVAEIYDREIASRLPGTAVTINYETLIKHPRDTISNIAEELGLDVAATEAAAALVGDGRRFS